MLLFIKIEKELDFEKIRADEYEKKYADLMINGETKDG